LSYRYHNVTAIYVKPGDNIIVEGRGRIAWKVTQRYAEGGDVVIHSARGNQINVDRLWRGAYVEVRR
jgi:hypothetical protein